MEDTKMVHKGKVAKALVATLSMLTLFLLAVTIKEFMSLSHLNDGSPQNTITVSGSGDVFAVPDIATFSFTVDETGTTVADAQTKADAKNNAALDYLKGQGIAATDIQTTDYSANPQYDYTNVNVCVKYPCPPSAPKITGYEVTETVSVKVRDTSKAGTILSGIGATGVSNLSGLSFTSDDQTTLEDQARAKAIADAKTQAQNLASELGVRLGKVASFSDNGGSEPMPVYAMKTEAMATGSVAAVPQISAGQNKVTVSVSVTYEIK